MDGKRPGPSGKGLAAAMVISLFLWVLILWAGSALIGKVEVRDNRTACERTNPPWAIAERCQ